ncbi:Reverse transcriptase zinc-binding domain [Dillenia turbinata]|uniref:Reverse transcriptase zinc-binding domain n=1 Tax=Dillenia turbinata TaxID=194707 RepID=A0AAN8VG14_9MAGN
MSPGQIWHPIWFLSVPTKVSNFIWRAATGCLPCKSQLHWRNVDVDLHCQDCDLKVESILQVLDDCVVARKCRLLSPTGLIKGIVGSFLELLELIFPKCQPDVVRMWLTAYWVLWKNRKVIFLPNGGMHNGKSLERIKRFVNEVVDRVVKRFVNEVADDVVKAVDSLSGPNSHGLGARFFSIFMSFVI